MAHYLDRLIGQRKTVHVLHDLKIEFEGERAQMDHVVLHEFGVAIVESKSVTTAVRINAADEWERQWSGRWQGMPNPLLQGQRQGMLLQRLLTSRTKDLLDTLAFGLLQGTFSSMAIDVFAAISDQGIIQRALPRQAPNALKADAVPNAILETILRHRKSVSLLNFNPKSIKDAPRDFKESEVLRVAHFLLRAHVGEAAGTPHQLDRTAEVVSEPTHNRPDKSLVQDRSIVLTCKSCGGSDLAPLIGKYGPYGQCRGCGKNTKVRPECPSCMARTRFERAPEGFAGTCAGCGVRTTFRLGSSSHP